MPGSGTWVPLLLELVEVLVELELLVEVLLEVEVQFLVQPPQLLVELLVELLQPVAEAGTAMVSAATATVAIRDERSMAYPLSFNGNGQPQMVTGK